MLKREATSWQHQAWGIFRDFINALVEIHEMLERGHSY